MRPESKVVVCLLVLAVMFAGKPALAATWLVDRFDDAVDTQPGDAECTTVPRGCSLRAAIMEANARPGVDDIHLTAGLHALTLMGASPEDAGASGDLDIREPVRLIGQPDSSVETLVSYPFVLHTPDGERVFDIDTDDHGTPVLLHRLVIQFGKAHDTAGGGGVLVRAGSVVHLDRVDLYANGADRRGNAMAVYGRAEIRRSHLFDNHPSWTSLPAEGGGAIYLGSGGVLVIDDVGFDSNRHRSGDVILADGPSEIEIRRSSFMDGPTAAFALRGPVQLNVSDSTISHPMALLATDGAETAFTHVTMHHAEDSVGVRLQGDSTRLSLSNSVMSRRLPGDVTCVADHGLVVSRGGNVFHYAAPCDLTPEPSDRIVDTLRLDGTRIRLPYSRFFPEHRWIFVPAADSHLIDAGEDAFCSPIDQVGTPRPFPTMPGQPPRCDAGAIEWPVMTILRDDFE